MRIILSGVDMQLKALNRCNEFVSELDWYLSQLGYGSLSHAQRSFVAFCMSGMILSGSLNFAAFSLASLGAVGAKAMSWMLHHSRISWSGLLRAAVLKVLSDHQVSCLHIVIDDTDRPRSKMVKALWGVFKTLDKATGGWIHAQNIVFMCLVTNKVTVPIFFTFYRPDPKFQAWKKMDKQLRLKGVKRAKRPSCPSKNSDFPTRIEIAVNLLLKLKRFIDFASGITGKLTIKSILFDTAYMSPSLLKACEKIYPGVQVISGLAKSQIVWDRSGKPKNLAHYFKGQQAFRTTVSIRGKSVAVSMLSARLFVKSHGGLLHVVAIKYDEEKEYRYLAASQLTWRSLDIIKAYALRWLIEVVNFDWKQHDGWGRKACQQGADGACRGMILSLLVDCFLLSHPAQLRQSRTGQQMWTAGSLIKRLQYDAILENVESIFECDNPAKALRNLVQNIEAVVKLQPSNKHMSGIEISQLGPSPSLQRVWS